MQSYEIQGTMRQEIEKMVPVSHIDGIPISYNI